MHQNRDEPGLLIDSHAHLDSYDDLDGVLARSEAAGVGLILAIGIGDGPETMGRALAIAKAPRSGSGGSGLAVYASAGIHPQEADQATPEALGKLRQLVADPRCLAVGEIGLDYYHVDNPDVGTQHAAFVAQMRVAAEVRKPILIHCRTSELARAEAKSKYGAADAWADLLALVDEHWRPTGLGGVMHCFSGTSAEAQASLDAGFYLSFAGNVTYPKSTVLREVAATAPADRILIETDAPFLAPVPHRGWQNEPALMVHTAEIVAGLRGVEVEDVVQQTSANFLRLFPGAAWSTRLA